MRALLHEPEYRTSQTSFNGSLLPHGRSSIVVSPFTGRSTSYLLGSFSQLLQPSIRPSRRCQSIRRPHTNLKQHGRLVEEYITNFQNCLSRVPPLQTEYQVAIFTAGLDEVLRIDVEYQQLLNLTMAISVARTFARKLQLWSSPPLPIGASTPEPTSTPPPSTQPSPPTQPPPPTRAPTSHTTIAPLKRLTRAEAAERRAKGLCYNSDEPYVSDHSCKRLFCLWIEGDEEAGESSNGPTTRTQGWSTNTAHHYPNVT
ncbi:hypothetical protein LINGRAHAP2_LOCUS4409 [Linum grandiflorum]